MKVLALESATERVGVALVSETGVLACWESIEPRRHAETMAPAIETVCSGAGIDLEDVDAIAVDVGPGLFTGLRVGLATAKGLSMALDVPLVTETSLHLLAASYADHGGVATPDALVVCVVDARRGEVFRSIYARSKNRLVLHADDALCAPEQLVAEIAGLPSSSVCIGNGAVRYMELLDKVSQVVDHDFVHPSAVSLGALGLGKLAANEVVSAHELTAHYLRDADVRINWETRFGRTTSDGVPARDAAAGER